MRTFFIKQTAWGWLRYGIIATLLVCLCSNFTSAQTVNLYGDSGYNSIYYPEVHNGYIYALGADDANGNIRESHLLKMDMTGNIVWQARLKAGTAINDFTTDGNGTFVITGRTGDARRAVVWKLKDQGTSYTTDCIKYFQLAGGRQGFNYVAYRSNTNDYLLHAVNLNSGDDVGLHTLDNNCNISSSTRYEGNFDHQFANGLMQDVSGSWTMMGDNGSNGNGVFVTVNNNLGYQEAFELRPGVGGRSNLRRGILDGNNKIMVGNAGGRTRGIILEVAPGGDLKWAMEIPQSTYLIDIHKGATNGNVISYYIMGETLVNGLTRWVLHKLDKPKDQKPSLVWTKMLDQNESEFGGGFPTYDQASGRIIYTDWRKDNANGFGNEDALVAILDKDFNSCITKELEHTLIDFELSLARINLEAVSIDVPQYIEGSQTEPIDYEYNKLCNSTNVCENNYFQNGDFEQVTGDPSASRDQDIDLAVGWSRVWNGGSIADLNDGGTRPTNSMTIPPNTGIYASFWITNDWYLNRDAIYREGMYNKLNTTIPQNSCSYDLSFKMANSMSISTANSQTYEIAIYGVYNPGGGSAITPTGMFTPRDLDLWGAASGNITLLGTVTVPVGIDQNWQTANLTFNAINAPASGITHIMITRGETLTSTLNRMYMYFDDFCLQKSPCERSTNFNCDLVDYNYTGGQLSYSFNVPSGIPSGNWTATGGAYGSSTVGIGSGLSTNYIFPSAGTYTICYSYLDEQGCEHICCKTIYLGEACDNGQLCDATSILNVNTGTDGQGNLLSTSTVDPFWQLINCPPTNSPSTCTPPDMHIITPYQANWNTIPSTGILNVVPGNGTFGANNLDRSQPWRIRREFCVCTDTEVCIEGIIRADDKGTLQLYDDSNPVGSPMLTLATTPAGGFNTDTPFKHTLALPVGTYHLEFEMLNTQSVAMGFAVQTQIRDLGGRNTILNSNPDESCCGRGTISIQKLLDEDCDETTPPTIGNAAWQFQAVNTITGQTHTGTTNGFGELILRQLPFGTYTITETVVSPWQAIGGATQTVTIDGINSIQYVEFVNQNTENCPCGVVNNPEISCSSQGIYNLNFTILNNSGRTGLDAEIALIAPFGVGYQGCAASMQTITGVGTSQAVNLNIEECFATLSTGTTIRYKVTLRDPNSEWCCHFEESTINIPDCTTYCPSDCPADPLISVPWLPGVSGNKEVYQCKLDGKCVYRITDCATADGLTTLYDCNGQIICLDGGIAGNTCADLARLTDCRVVKICPSDDCVGTANPDRICNDDYTPVCGCDGNTYSNICYAEREGILSWTQGECNNNCNDCTGTDLVKNGDFEGGNWGFSSDLNQNCRCVPSSYCIGFTPRDKCPNSAWKSITSSGKFLIVDGGSIPYNIWKQNNLTVATGKKYNVSFDFYPNVSDGSSPTLQLLINNTVVLNNITAPLNKWTTHNIAWTASISGNVELTIRQIGNGSRDDFAIDNIKFVECNAATGDPLQDYAWLQPFVGDPNFSISECTWNGETIYQIFDFCIASDGGIYYYDCEGDLICETYQIGGTCDAGFSPQNCTPLQTCNTPRSRNIENREKSVEKTISLTNFPNPFNKNTTILFELPTEMEATISVFDISGRIVFTQSDTFQAGENRVELDASHKMTSGLYYYRLETNEQVLTKSMLMLQE